VSSFPLYSARGISRDHGHPPPSLFLKFEVIVKRHFLGVFLDASSVVKRRRSSFSEAFREEESLSGYVLLCPLPIELLAPPFFQGCGALGTLLEMPVLPSALADVKPSHGAGHVTSLSLISLVVSDYRLPRRSLPPA